MGLIDMIRQKMAGSAQQLEDFESGLVRALDIIVGQTDLSRTAAAERLEENNMNVLQTIREATGSTEHKEEVSDTRSLNQRMYAEYRGFLDEASRKHAAAKEQRERVTRAVTILQERHSGLQNPKE